MSSPSRSSGARSRKLASTASRSRFGKRDLSSITPADTAAAQAALLEIVDKALKRLRRLKAKRREVAGIVEKLQPDILGHDDSKGGHNLRRHVESTNKLIHRNIEVIYKRRRDEATGWGKTRQERERRKGGGIKDEGGIRACGCDLRLVMDEEGMIHVAQTYKGNLEEGLARHREAFQPKLEGAPCSLPVVSDENDVPRVKDYAHWIKEERLKQERLEAEMSQVAEAEPDSGDETEGAGQEAVVTMEPATEGDRAKIQNEPRPGSNAGSPGGPGRRPEVDAPGSEACAGGSPAVRARPQPPTVCHPPSLAVEAGQENLASKPEPARKKAAGDLASPEKNSTSKPELARNQPVGEPASEEKNWWEQDVQPAAGVEVRLKSCKPLVLAREVDWDSLEKRPLQAWLNSRKVVLRPADVTGVSELAGEELGEFPGEDDHGDGARAEGGDQDAAGGDLASGLEPRLLGIADRAGQGVDGAVGQLGDQDQAGADHEQAPAPLIDAQQRGRDHDQRAAIAVGEEARVAADRRLDARASRPPACCARCADRPGRSGPTGSSRSSACSS